MKTLLGALLLLVVATGTAFAECAWVLWREQTYLATAWTTIPATQDERECAARQREWEAKPLPKDQFYEGTRLRYVCLPDTVDPRGLKGGAR